MVEREDEISLKDLAIKLKAFISYLKIKTVFIVLVVVAFVCISLWFYFKQEPKYIGESTFLVEEKSNSSLGGLSGLASQFGFDMGSSGSSGGLFAGDNILDILKSRSIVEKVLLSKIVNNNWDTISLADLYLSFKGYKKQWHANPRLDSISFQNNNSKEQLSLLQDSILYFIYKGFIKTDLITDRLSKKSTIFTIQVTSVNEIFSKNMTERLVNESRNLYITLKTKTAQANIDRLEIKADSLLQLLNSKSYQTARSQILDANPALKEATVPTELSLRDKTVVTTIYTEVVKNLEASKMALSQQTPVIQILDSPSFPLEDNLKGKLYYIIIAALIGLFISILTFLIKYYFKP